MIREKIKKLLIEMLCTYEHKIGNDKNWVCVSYLTETFRINNRKYMLSHQNKMESLYLRDIFNEIGYNFRAIRFDKKLNKKYKKFILKDNYKIIFGIENNFINISELCDNAIKVYYATGSYYEHQNKMIVKRTDDVNRKRGSNIPYKRLVDEHKSIDICDYIIQIGSKYTIDTYPSEYRDKIITIRQTTCELLKPNLEEKLNSYSSIDFLWFGGKGSILKGLDLTIEYFSNNDSLNLHIVGPLDEEFKLVYNDELYNTKNIKYYGYMNIDSKELYDIANKCSFIILPSASEGGVPGSVLNMMKLGLIPIVSQYAAFDEIEDYGILIEDLSKEGIELAVEKALKMNSSKLEKLFEMNSNFVKDNYNKFTFKDDIKLAINKILEDRS